MVTAIQVVIDCADPEALSRFWALALGYKLQDPPAGSASWPEWLAASGIPEERWNDASAVVDPDGRGPRIYFQRVPEGKAVKNRVHLDLNVGGGPGAAREERRERVDAEAQRLAGYGATLVGVKENDFGEYCAAMCDPEGNEFDVQ
jgi:Glyoxalase-like domain